MASSPTLLLYDDQLSLFSLSHHQRALGARKWSTALPAYLTSVLSFPTSFHFLPHLPTCFLIAPPEDICLHLLPLDSHSFFGTNTDIVL